MFSVKDVNLHTMIDTLLWYETWPLSGYNHARVKQKLLRKRTRGAYKSSWSRQGNQKSFTLTIPKNLANPVKTCPGIIVRQHLTDRKQMGLLRERCAELRKGLLWYCCNQVWTKNGWRAICETFKMSCRIGRHFMRGGSEYHSMARLFRLERWWNITLFLLKTCRDCISSAQKVLHGIFLRHALHAGRIWKGDILVDSM